MFATTGGMGQEAMKFMKTLAEKIATKKQERYCDVIGFIRRRLCFDILKTCLISIRGFRGIKRSCGTDINYLDFGLRPQAVS